MVALKEWPQGGGVLSSIMVAGSAMTSGMRSMPPLAMMVNSCMAVFESVMLGVAEMPFWPKELR